MRPRALWLCELAETRRCRAAHHHYRHFRRRSSSRIEEGTARATARAKVKADAQRGRWLLLLLLFALSGQRRWAVPLNATQRLESSCAWERERSSGKQSGGA